MQKVQPPAVGTAERNNYEEAITKLSLSNSLSRFLLGFIALMCIIGVFLVWQNGVSQRQADEEDRQRQNQVLEEIRHSTNENEKSINRVLNYLNCVGTVPVEQRTKEFIKKCFEDANAERPSVSSIEPDIGIIGPTLGLEGSTDPPATTQQSGSVGLNPQPSGGSSSTPPPSNGGSTTPPPAQPIPSLGDVLGGTIEGLLCNQTITLVCRQR